MSEKQDKLIAEIAAGHQRVYDRQEVIEDVFRDSIIIPGSKLTAILSATIVMVLLGCMTFAFVFWLIRPI